MTIPILQPVTDIPILPQPQPVAPKREIVL
jgi:hypothetical protein